MLFHKAWQGAAMSGRREADAVKRIGFAALAALLLLTSCSFFSADSLDLLQAPVLNARQAELQEALGLTVNLSEIMYIYPQQGEHRSPFLFADLTGDGVEEAVVLYAYADDPSSIWAKLLRQDEQGNWLVFHDEAGQGDQVEFINFSPLITQEAVCIVIGWKNSRNGKTVLGVYSLEETRLREHVLQEYDNYEIYDLDGDGLTEILMTGPVGQGGGLELMLWHSLRNKLIMVDNMALEPDAVSVLQMLRGVSWDGRQIVYLDEKHENATIGTEVIAVEGVRLRAVAAAGSGDEQLAVYYSTLREGELSTEINQAIFVPQLWSLPQQGADDTVPSLPLVEYRRLTEAGYESHFYAVVNEEDGYRLLFPDEWVGRVTVEQRVETGEWRFYRVSADTREPETELLRIWVYSAGDYRDRFTENYFLLNTRGPVQYYGYIATEEDELAITPEDVFELFQLTGRI